MNIHMNIYMNLHINPISQWVSISSHAKKLRFHLTSTHHWNLPDSQFCSESKTEPKCSMHRTKFGVDTAQKKCIPGGGTPHLFSEQGANRKGRGHRTHFLNRGPIGGDTAHQKRLPVVIESIRKRWAGWVVS